MKTEIRFIQMLCKASAICGLVVLMSACGVATTHTRGSEYAGMYENMPVTLLVLPPINNTSNVVAKDYLYTSISRPLIEAGYYVLSPMLVMDVLKSESAYDTELFVDMPLNKFHDFFGADAVVFSEINSWDKVGFGISTDIRYYIRSATSGEIIFDKSCKLYLDLSSDIGSNDSVFGQLLNLATSAISTATTDHIVAARKANSFIFSDIPRGKYSPDYMLDKEIAVQETEIKTTVR